MGFNRGLRIMQLQYEEKQKEAKIVDGFEMWLSSWRRNYFGLPGDGIEISSWYTPEEKRNVKAAQAFDVKNLGDGFKDIQLVVSDQKVEEENAILLLVNPGTFSIDGTKINRLAGRFPETGAYLLEPGDRIVTSRWYFTEEFVALQFERKMYLVKIHD